MKNIIKTLLLLILPILCFNSIAQNNVVEDSIYSLSEKYNYTVSKLLEGNCSHPQWSPNGNYISFTGNDYKGIFMMHKDSLNIRTLNNDLGAGYKYAWALDNTHIAYRGTRFVNNKREQFIGVINIKTNADTNLVFHNRLQPPVWQYLETGKKVLYVFNNEIICSDEFNYEAEEFSFYAHIPNINIAFFYNQGAMSLIDLKLKNTENTQKIEGMDAVIAPDKDKFVFSRDGQLVLSSFSKSDEIILDDGRYPSWSPDSKKIVYQKTSDDGYSITTSDLYIFDITALKKYTLTETEDFLEANPSWSPSGNEILFNDELKGNIYLLKLNY